jgi:uncharacterized damage-inducible protein DinB
MPWFDRRWKFDFPAENYADIVERVRGTPARIEERLEGAAPAALTRREGDTWSVQENAGHLLDVEELWVARTREVIGGAREYRPADLRNTRTHEARHNEADIAGILARFRTARGAWVAMLEGLPTEDFARSAHHPRLKRDMRLVDLCAFVADHDDHHLARISLLLKGGGAAR